MNRADIFIQVMSEISGKPRDEVTQMLVNFRRVHPGGKWEREVAPEKAEELIANLRKDGLGILAWFIRGAGNGSRLAGRA